MRCPFCHNGDLVSHPMGYPNACDEVADYLSRRRGLLDGVCVSGGEPLLQPDLKEFLKQLKAWGYLVKLDTNGTLPQKLREMLETGLVDYVAMDIKSSPAGYARAAGCEIDPALPAQSAALLRELQLPHEFRTTAVKGIHTVSDFEEIGKWLGGEDPYFIQGFVDSGKLLGGGCTAFDPEEMGELLRAAKAYFPNAQLRGLSE